MRPGVTPPPKLLDRVRDAIRVRHYSRRTEEAYAHWVRRFIVFHKMRHPSTMGAAEIASFLTWLAVRQRVSASTQNQALSALLFLYRDVLHLQVGSIEHVPRARTPERVPVVLSRDEVRQVMRQLAGTSWLVVALLYGAGLRLQECLELRVKDIDVDRHQVVVRRGKGQKDRRTMLPAAVEARLVAHLGEVKQQHERDLVDGVGRHAVCARPKVPECVERLGVAVCISGGTCLSGSTVRPAVAVSSARVGGAAGRDPGGSEGDAHQAGWLSHVSAFLCDAPAGGRIRHPDRTGVARACRCGHGDVLRRLAARPAANHN